jgi:hypothetical protein
VAPAASRRKASYVRAKYASLKSRIGGGKAARAIGHKPLIGIWHMVSKGCFDRDVSEAYPDRRNQRQTLKLHTRKLDARGFASVPRQQAVATAASPVTKPGSGVFMAGAKRLAQQARR